MFIDLEEGGRGKEKRHRLVVFRTRLYWGSNLQPEYVSWQGMGPAPFWCMGWRSNQLSHQARATSYIFKCIQLITSTSKNLSYRNTVQRLARQFSWLEHHPNTSRLWVRSLVRTHEESTNEHWLMWLSGLSTGLWIKRSPVGFPVRTHARVAGQVPGARGNQSMYLLHIDVSLPLSFPSPLSKIK